MTRPTRRRGIATGLLVAALLITSAACDDDTEPETLPSEPSTSDTSSTPSPTEPTETTSEPASEDDEAAAGAEDLLREYYALEDRITADPEMDLQSLEDYLQDPELTAKRSVLQQLRDEGFTSSGATSFDSIEATKVRLFPKKNDAAVTLRACLNLEQVVLKDRNGKRVDLLTPALATFEVYNYDYPSPDGWRIAVGGYPGQRCKA